MPLKKKGNQISGNSHVSLNGWMKSLMVGHQALFSLEYLNEIINMSVYRGSEDDGIYS